MNHKSIFKKIEVDDKADSDELLANQSLKFYKKYFSTPSESIINIIGTATPINMSSPNKKKIIVCKICHQNSDKECLCLLSYEKLKEKTSEQLNTSITDNVESPLIQHDSDYSQNIGLNEEDPLTVDHIDMYNNKNRDLYPTVLIPENEDDEDVESIVDMLHEHENEIIIPLPNDNIESDENDKNEEDQENVIYPQIKDNDKCKEYSGTSIGYTTEETLEIFKDDGDNYSTVPHPNHGWLSAQIIRLNSDIEEQNKFMIDKIENLENSVNNFSRYISSIEDKVQTILNNSKKQEDQYNSLLNKYNEMTNKFITLVQILQAKEKPYKEDNISIEVGSVREKGSVSFSENPQAMSKILENSKIIYRRLPLNITNKLTQSEVVHFLSILDENKTIFINWLSTFNKDAEKLAPFYDEFKENPTSKKFVETVKGILQSYSRVIKERSIELEKNTKKTLLSKNKKESSNEKETNISDNTQFSDFLKTLESNKENTKAISRSESISSLKTVREYGSHMLDWD